MKYNYKLARFLDDISDKRIGFLGIGVSHLGIVRMLARKNFNITVRDIRTLDKLDPNIVEEFTNIGVELILGNEYLISIDEDIVFRTPGMNFNHPIFSELKSQGKVVTSEMEVFFDLCPCKIFGVTGSDGKTTTSTIISEILKAAGYTVHLGGNIGCAMLSMIQSIDSDDIVVVELSSFQLISMKRSPDVAVITNISPNHLDVHKTMEEYIDAKKNIFLYQNSFNKVVLNLDDSFLKKFIEQPTGRIYTFSSKVLVQRGAFIDSENNICINDEKDKKIIMNTSDIFVPGQHNVLNYLAAITATQEYVNDDVYKKVAKSFKGVEHRIEFVKDLNNVKWYNDSIATSPSRTIAALKSFGRKVILIAGGYNKNIPYEPLAPYLIKYVSCLILMGDTSQIIYDALIKSVKYTEDIMDVYIVDNLVNATKKAYEISKAGDIVLLSPASSSLDFYENFSQRGNHFKRIINNFNS